jgi:crossover junction endodeoxyribonuclease RusA
MFTGPIAMWIHATPPDRRRRDIDNILKAPLDALEKAGVYKDDSQIEQLNVFKHRPMKGGFLNIKMCGYNLGHYVDIF